MIENDTNYFDGKTIVFFAIINEWKTAMRDRPRRMDGIFGKRADIHNSEGIVLQNSSWIILLRGFRSKQTTCGT